MELRPWQTKAVSELDNGKVLYGEVGGGKTIAALAYYAQRESRHDLVVVTTARKRDTLDWQTEALRFGITDDPETSVYGTITVDSWNNIGDYVDRKDCFFIFDEQRVVGTGAWVKSFIKISKQNRWILLTGTPGDTWLDYAPVFIANGFYRNITQFKREHVIYEPHARFPKIRGYLGERKLALLRNHILVEMPFPRHTKRYLNWLDVDYDKERFAKVYKNRWNVFEDAPCRDVSEMWRTMRRVVNMDPSRLHQIYDLLSIHPRLIIYYTFDYELDILRRLDDEIEVFEYNGHHHDPTPTGDRWVYLVQYTSGAEAWNCVTTNAMVFYSLTYSWKNFEQCQGRIDRLNTDYENLYYYILVSNSVIDRAIRASLKAKKEFNERKEARKLLAEQGISPAELG